ncbi:hypothetical protein GGG16DRAFT_119335 [Schizophyllum commune]
MPSPLPVLPNVPSFWSSTPHHRFIPYLQPLVLRVTSSSCNTLAHARHQSTPNALSCSLRRAQALGLISVMALLAVVDGHPRPSSMAIGDRLALSFAWRSPRRSATAHEAPAGVVPNTFSIISAAPSSTPNAPPPLLRRPMPLFFNVVPLTSCFETIKKANPMPV